MGNLTIELEFVTNATNCINCRSQNFKRYRENSSRLEFSENSRGTRSPKLEQAEKFIKKKLHSVIYEALGSHSHGFSIVFRKFEPARVFRRFLKLQVSKTRAGANFQKNLHSVIYEALGSHSHGFSIFLENSSRLEFSETS